MAPNVAMHASAQLVDFVPQVFTAGSSPVRDPTATAITGKKPAHTVRK
jgi:hypothetical protein